MPTWLIYAFLSALAAALVPIFGRMGVKDVDTNLATIVRSTFMTLFLVAFGLAMRVSLKVQTISGKAMLAIALSGVAGAVSWLFYFRALRLATVSKVAPIDKLSMPLGIVLAVLILGERPTPINWLGIGLIAAGAYLATIPGAAQ